MQRSAEDDAARLALASEQRASMTRTGVWVWNY